MLKLGIICEEDIVVIDPYRLKYEMSHRVLAVDCESSNVEDVYKIVNMHE